MNSGTAMQKTPTKTRAYPPKDLEGLADCQGLPHEYLHVGQGAVYRTPTLVQTVLGSCVSVTMHCARNGWGGIFHALLPRIGDYSKPSSPADPYRYVDSSIMELLREFSRAGIYPDSLECKVFGGASPLHQDSDVSAGKRNVEAAMETLARAGVTVSASSVGGNVGRKLFFRTDTGLVLQKRFLVRPGKEAAR